MVCELDDDAVWPALLTARALLAHAVGDLLLVHRGTTWSCVPAAGAELATAQQVLGVPDPRATVHEYPAPPADCALSLYSPQADGQPHFLHATRRPVAPSVLSMARVYLPVLLGAVAVRAAGRVFVAGHVTQTLDGRIACANGQSQWIGNAADLRHAHRMRALLDGVMIGARTALADDPQLTVRHVTGPDPRRIVLSGSGRVLHGAGLHIMAGTGCEIIVGDDVAAAPPTPAAHVIKVRSSPDRIPPATILEALRVRNLHSIYLEGGAMTLSSFLQAGCIDLLQVHIAAMVLGSGMPSFNLPVVDHVRDGIRFAIDHTMLDGHVLLSCWQRRATIV